MSEGVFKDKVVVITGASSGIGRELGCQLASQGALLCLAARTSDRLEAVKGECEARGGKAITLPTDVGERAECASLVQRTVEHYSRIDMLVNNAGRTMMAKFEDIRDLSLFDQLVRVNCLGSVYCTAYALPYLKQTRGRIVGISSLVGKTGVPTRTGYAASKHAMAGFFDSLRIETSSSGVSVTMVYPGFVDTPIREQALDANGRPMGPQAPQEPRAMSVEKCARAIIRGAARRDREVVMPWQGKLAIWMKVFMPGVVDRLARKTMSEAR
jgi:short-subunit dehydrogenase